MTLPTLPPCTVPDCPAPIAHWHGGDDDLYACISALNGRPCPHDDQGHPCYAPRVTDPLHLPDVDAVARVIYESDYGTNWATASEGVKDRYRRNTRDVLNLIAAHQPVWVPINVDDIRPGMRVRWVRVNSDAEGSFTVRLLEDDRLYSENGHVSRQMPYTWSVDPRTIPAPTLTERIRAALDDSPESRITLDVADVEALLDMAGGEDK